MVTMVNTRVPHITNGVRVWALDRSPVVKLVICGFPGRVHWAGFLKVAVSIADSNDDSGVGASYLEAKAYQGVRA